ncbi:MAG: TRAP transporter large permease [Planctomycetota bacterium]|jgi:C4-dicarboxylate transporter DctM subunit|nr:TRAP transporter large permease [Planctomycetota bacterium]
MIWLVFSLLGGLCLAGVPVAFSIGIAAIGGIMVRNVPLTVVDQRMFTQIDSFAMLAIPFFILAGNLMDRGGISEKIVQFATDVVGHIRGGLAMVSVIASMFFGAISGSAQATSAAIGSILIPAMEKHGYDKPFAAALTATSGPLGVIIPPSIPMVIFAAAANVSIGKLFLGGYLPGLFIGLGLMLVCYFYALRNNYATDPRVSLLRVLKSFLDSAWALLMVVIIMGGILGGYFTATEASVVAVVYAVFVGRFIYRKLVFADVPDILYRSAMVTATVMFCVAATNILGWIMTREQIPRLISGAMLSVTGNKYLILLFINFLLLILGMILDATPAIILTVPILLSVVTNLGVDPIHFGLIVVANLAIGMSTPPVGITLFVSSGISGVPISRMIRPLIPFWIVMTIFLMVLTYVPALTMFLPGLVN